MDCLILHTYAYAGNEGRKLLMVAYSVNLGPICFKELRGPRNYLPADLRFALTTGRNAKFSVDPGRIHGELSTCVPEGDNCFSDHWFPMAHLLEMLGLPDDLYTAMRFFGRETPEREVERGCVERFCKPDPVFGKQADPSEFAYQWEAMKRIAKWKVDAMRYIIKRFDRTFASFVRNSIFRRTYSFENFAVNMPLYEEYTGIHNRRIDNAVNMYNSCVQDNGTDKEMILDMLLNLKKELRYDYAAIEDHVKDGYIEKPPSVERCRYEWAEMLYGIFDLAEGEELLLLDYRDCNDKVRKWISCDPEREEVIEGYNDLFRIAIWQAMNSNEKIQCGRLRVVRRWHFLFITLPSRDRLILPHPSYSYDGVKWILEYDVYTNGSIKRVKITTNELLKRVTQLALEAYVAARASLVVPREQLLLCEGSIMILRLMKGKLFTTNRPICPGRMWIRRLSLSPEIVYRTGGAYE